MANSRKNDSIWCDTTGDVTVDSPRPVLYGVLLRLSAAAGSVVIKESSSTGTIKFEYEVASDGDSRFIDLGMLSKGRGIVLTPTFHITVTNLTSCILYGDWNTRT